MSVNIKHSKLTRIILPSVSIGNISRFRFKNEYLVRQNWRPCFIVHLLMHCTAGIKRWALGKMSPSSLENGRELKQGENKSSLRKMGRCRRYSKRVTCKILNSWLAKKHNWTLTTNLRQMHLLSAEACDSPTGSLVRITVLTGMNCATSERVNNGSRFIA